MLMKFRFNLGSGKTILEKAINVKHMFIVFDECKHAEMGNRKRQNTEY